MAFKNFGKGSIMGGYSTCPVTFGLPTTMPLKSFHIVCDAMQHKKNTLPLYCEFCNGELPEELTIGDLTINIKPEKELVMKQKCEQCDRPNDLKKNHGKMVCPSCVVIRGAARNRPGSVMSALREFNNIESLLTPEEIANFSSPVSLREKANIPAAELLAAKTKIEKLNMEIERLANLLKEQSGFSPVQQIAIDFALGHMEGKVSGVTADQVRTLMQAN